MERFLRGFLDLVTVGFLTRFMVRPMHLFGMLGTLSFASGFVMAAWISFDKVVFGQPIGDRPLLLFAVMLVVVGVQMFTTGLLGETIIRPAMETTNRYQVAEESRGGRLGSVDAPTETFHPTAAEVRVRP